MGVGDDKTVHKERKIEGARREGSTKGKQKKGIGIGNEERQEGLGIGTGNRNRQ